MKDNRDNLEINNLKSWKKDHPDFRDYKYEDSHKLGFFKRGHSSYDLTPHLSPVEDQRSINSCTANAIVTQIEKDNGKKDISRLFLYYTGREKSNLQKRDDGAYLRDVLKAAREGVCLEEIYPYDVDLVYKKPSKKAYSEANQTIQSFYRIHSNKNTKRKQITHSIERGNIIVFGGALFDSFLRLKESVWRGPTDDDKILGIKGWHAMAIVGFNKKDKLYKIRNSWSHKWGDDGYCWVPEEYLFDLRFNEDFWSIA